jgi:hypothetical protein
VNYCGTAAQWSAITIASLDNDTLVNATRNYHVVTAGSCTEDKVCTICGAIVEKATGHAYESAVTAPTCVAEGYTTYTCACGGSYVDNKVPATGEHTYVDGVCSGCGATEETGPILDESLAFAKKGILLGSYIGAQFQVKTKAAKAYDSVYILVEFQGNVFKYDVTILNGYFIYEHGIAPKDMNKTLKVTAYGIKDGVLYCGNTEEWSVKGGLMERLETAYATISEEKSQKMCTLLVDMLFYGAQAQTTFGTAEADGLVTEGLDAKYLEWRTSADPELTAENDISARAENTMYRYNLGLQEAVTMQMTFYLAQDYVYGEYTVKISHDGKVYEYNEADWSVKSGKNIVVVFDKLGAADMRDEVTIELWRNGELVSPVYKASIAGVAKINVDGDKNVSLVKAMMAYGDSAKNYLG